MTVARNSIATLLSIALLSMGTNCSGTSSATTLVPSQLEPSQEVSGGGGIIPIMGSTNYTSPLCIAPWMVTGSSRCGGVASGIYFPSNGKLVALAVVLVENAPSGGRVFIMVNGVETALSADVPLSSSTPILVRADVPITAGDKVEIASTSGTGEYFWFNASLEYRTN